MQPDCDWYGASLTLRCIHLHPERKAHALSVLEAIVKGMAERAGLAAPDRRTVFRWPGQRCTSMVLRENQLITLDVQLFGADAAEAGRWHDCVASYFDAGGPGRNFRIETLGGLENRRPQQPRSKDTDDIAGDEICLDLLTPLPFKPSQAHDRTWMDGEAFLRLCRDRLRKLFRAEPELPPAPQILTAYWRYHQIAHAARSQAGHTKYLNGCIGPLYLRSAHLESWRPWLALFEQINLGGQISFGQGSLRVLWQAPPVFDASLADPGQVRQSLAETLERHDDLVLALAQSPLPIEETALAHELARSLHEGFKPEPFQAFTIPRPSGGTRRIEKAGPRELIVLNHLARLLSEPFDRLFSVHSIGYRRGHSREDAVARVRQGLAEGCDHVLESDIADFFPSIDHAQLLARLDEILPRRDQRLRGLLADILACGYSHGNGAAEARTRGLPLGSPLSPLLANLYLDRFDARIGMEGVRLIRYADDFIILTQGIEAAHRLLGLASATLSDMGLALNLDKTAVRPIAEGFTFLGIRFGADAEAEAYTRETADALKKPLYVIEPYTSLGLNRDAIDLRRGHSVVATFPLQRISQIVTLAPVTLSSALIARCADNGVPIVLAAGNGRPAATIAGDNAGRYAIAARHAEKFARMSTGEHLSLARAFAAGKLANYCALLKQRYQPGSNELIARLHAAITAIEQAEDVDVVRGIEGQAARTTFPKLAEWVNLPDFQWHGRKAHGEMPDRLNSLLNFSYHLLFNRINALIRLAGLNPYLGFLHAPNGRYEALVCDVQELFRANMDRFVVRILNLRIIAADDFEETPTGFWLIKPARARFLEQFAREMERRPIRRDMSQGEAIEGQVRSLVDYMIRDRELILYRWENPPHA